MMDDGSSCPYFLQKQPIVFHFFPYSCIISHSTLESTETMFPGPLAEAMGWCRGTMTGDTNTDNLFPSGDSIAVPSNLMVERIILAYSKSTFVKLEMPWHGTLQYEKKGGRGRRYGHQIKVG